MPHSTQRKRKALEGEMHPEEQMNVAELEEIEYLLKNASPDWCIYSEPEVGMPPSLFSGAPGTVDFQPIEPLQCHDLLLARLAPHLARRVIAAEKLVEALENAIDALKYGAHYPEDNWVIAHGKKAITSYKATT